MSTDLGCTASGPERVIRGSLHVAPFGKGTNGAYLREGETKWIVSYRAQGVLLDLDGQAVEARGRPCNKQGQAVVGPHFDLTSLRRLESTRPAPPDAAPTEGDESVLLAYPCGEKYESAGQCEEGSVGYANWLAHAPAVVPARSTDPQRAIQGGGPEGAEWNPSNDVLVLVRDELGVKSIRVGNHTLRDPRPARSGWSAFRVPQRVWGSAVRAPSGSHVSVVDIGLVEASRSVSLWVAYGE